jgi:hypothetical protein
MTPGGLMAVASAILATIAIGGAVIALNIWFNGGFGT